MEPLDLLPLAIPLAAVVVLALAWLRPEWIFVTDPDDGERAPRCRFLRSHAYGRPYTESGRRVVECEHCAHVAPFVWDVPRAARATQETIDGNVAASLVVLDRDTAIANVATYRRAKVAASVRAKHGKGGAA